MDTSEFLVWTLGYTCSIRGALDGSDPERTERHLRSARATGDALREGRVLDGLCVDPPSGFRIAEALQIYGGLDTVEQTCASCPANAIAGPGGPWFAGCYGLVPFPDDSALHAALEETIARLRLQSQIAEQFLPTQPRRYGLFAQSPLSPSQATTLHRILKELLAGNEEFDDGLKQLAQALEVAVQHGLALHVATYPRGSIEENRWWLVRHCPRCKAAWLNDPAQPCKVCQYAGRPAPDRKRHVRGRRPYVPLERLLGAERAKEFIVRYAASPARRQSPDQAENQPPPGPRDSPPAGSGSAAC